MEVNKTIKEELKPFTSQKENVYINKTNNSIQKNNYSIFNIKYFLILIFLFVHLPLYYYVFKNIIKIKYKNKNFELNKFENNLLLSTNQIYNKKNKIISNKFFIKKINETYEKQGFVNINEIESTFPEGKSWKKNQNKTNEINIGAGFDKRYILRSMMTIASIMDSQKLNTKIRFHFGVVDRFSVEDMIKVYTLRERIRDDVEFNFYNAKRVETEFKGINRKGNSLCARLLLPELLPNDVERLIMFDTGDVLILRDLSEMYNWNMENKIYAGVLDVGVMKYGKISKKKMDIYINAGNYLLDVKKAKNERMYEKFTEKKNYYRASKIADQDILNDVAIGKIGYLPMKFGIIAPFGNDKDSDTPPYNTDYKYVERLKLKYKKKYPFLPKNRYEMNLQAYNPVVIHQWNGKWMLGSGLSIYRRLAQYYIKLAGIWDEMCQKHPGFCMK